MQKLLKTIGVLLLLIFFIVLSKYFVKTDYFDIKEIQINGGSKLLKVDIMNKLETLKEKNIVYINTKEIEKTLEKDARIKKISIRKIYPSKLIIDLESKDAYVYVKKGDELFLADKDLNIFGYIFEIEPKNIPIVIYNTEEEKKDLKNIVSKIENKELYDIISEIKKKGKDYEILLIDGIIIKTDPTVSSKKYDEAYIVYEKAKVQRSISVMDIRFVKDINVK